MLGKAKKTFSTATKLRNFMNKDAEQVDNEPEEEVEVEQADEEDAEEKLVVEEEVIEKEEKQNGEILEEAIENDKGEGADDVEDWRVHSVL